MIGALIANGRDEPPQPEIIGVEVPIERFFPASVTVQDIERFVLEGQELDEPVGIYNTPEGGWFQIVLDGDDTRLNPESAEFARWVLFNIGATNSIDRGQNPMEDYGLLPSPKYVVSFRLRDGSFGDFFIGDLVPSGNAYYVAFDMETSIIYSVPMDWVETFVMTMRQLEPIAAPTDAVPETAP
jgi:hypothetical protein